MQHLIPSSEEEIRLRVEDSAEIDSKNKLGGIKRIKTKPQIQDIFKGERKSVERKVPVKTTYKPRENRVL
jgi:hypothetical protein